MRKVIEDHALYTDQRVKLPAEDVIKQMRRDISVTRGGETAFQISFFYPDRHKAQEVTRELIDRFVEVNATERAATGATFKVIEMPALPSAPADKTNVKAVIGGSAAGLLLGFSVFVVRNRLWRRGPLH